MNEVKIFFTAEKSDFKVEEKEGKKGIKISGIAMPLNETSRNGVYYRPESVKKAYQTLKNASFLYNHNTEISLGHVEDVGINEKEVTYTADIDPEEKKYVSKVERGDIRHVSIGAMVANPNYREDGIVEVDITEFVELSLVPVPGFKQATASKQGLEGALYLKEAFGELKKESEEEIEDTEETESKEESEVKTEEAETITESEETQDLEESKTAETIETTETTQQTETKEEAESEDEETEDTEEQKMEYLSKKVNEQSALIEELQNRLAILEARMDTYEETESQEESQEETKEEQKEEIIEGRVEIPTDSKVKVINLNERRLKRLSY